MNILISDVCNRKCDFCFAKDAHKAKAGKFMSLENINKICEFNKKSGEYSFSCIGGEPSLHPEFIQALEIIRNHEMHLMLFTNGIMHSDKVDYLADEFAKFNTLGILCNLTYSKFDTQYNIEQRDYFLRRLHEYIKPSITVSSPIFEYEYIFDYVQKYDLQRAIRIGTAHPIANTINNFLPLKYFKSFGIMFTLMRSSASKLGIDVRTDCGMTPCMCEGVNSNCRVILDVGVDLQVWPCFPLTNYMKVHLFDFDNIGDVFDYFTEKLKNFKNEYIFDDCISCKYIKACNGGCVAHKINRKLSL